MTDFREILRSYWGYPDFRGIQRDIIESIAARQRHTGTHAYGRRKKHYLSSAYTGDGMECVWWLRRSLL